MICAFLSANLSAFSQNLVQCQNLGSLNHLISSLTSYVKYFDQILNCTIGTSRKIFLEKVFKTVVKITILKLWV